MSLNKYDYEHIIDEKEVAESNTSHSKLLKNVKKNSDVLEFGSATGIMTQYMKEKLNCRVFIVELDESSFHSAMNYAVDGYNGNIESDGWIRKIGELKFDYIIFADVLEHLFDPKQVLEKAKDFLKPNGSILISVPNIANGDIIMNLLNDNFIYTQLGLLDNTHVHFFTRKTLKEMLSRVGLEMVIEDATYVPTFGTEQGRYIDVKNRNELEDAIGIHPTRNIYQLICQVKKKEDVCKTISKIDEWLELFVGQGLQSKFYFDFGEGYSEERTTIVQGDKLDENVWSYNVKIPEECKSIRFDPVENKKCILCNVKILLDGKNTDYKNLNGIRVGEYDFFFCEDPQIQIAVEDGSSCLNLEAYVEPIGKNGWGKVQSAIEKLRESQNKENLFYESKNEELTLTNRRLQKDLEETVKQIKLHDENQRKLLNEEIARLKGMLVEKDNIITQYQSSISWKITKPLRKIKEMIKF